ncbi:MAG: class B sortase [Lachnospiraceae bacterium]|nr:class B sortase [Lachnospiraceae bacterium]
MFAFSLIGLGYFGFRELHNEIQVHDMEKKVRTYKTDEKTDGFDWEGLKSANSDTIGWLHFDVPEQIDYPIVQGESNQKYLKTDFYGQYSIYGAIFLNKNNKPDFTDMNSIIYGHRMIDGSMFGSLKKYGDQAFLDDNPYFYISTPDGKKRKYEICIYAKVTDGTDVYSFNFESPKERNKQFQMIRDGAITSRDVELDELDTTVILSTCASRGYYDRMIVIGKLIGIYDMLSD